MTSDVRPTTAPSSSHVDTLRTLRKQRRMERMQTPSASQKKVVESTHVYLTTRVDPVMSKVITYMLIEQPKPENIISVLLKYFTELAAGVTLEPNSAAKQNRKTNSADRLYMAKAMSPVFTKLMNLLLALRPSNVPEYLVGACQGFVDNDEFKNLGVVAVAKPPTVPETVAPAVAAEASATPAAQVTADATAITTTTSVEAAPSPEKKKKVAYPKKMVILMLGLDGAGKSTMLAAVQGDPEPKCKPTVGFVPNTLRLENSQVQFYDLGGGDNIRDIWDSYYGDGHAIVYVIDAAADDMKFGNSIKVAKETLGHEYISKKPTLIFCNKSESKAARTVEEVAEELGMSNDATTKIVSSTMHPKMTPTGEVDGRIDEALEWLFDTVAVDFDSIKERVKKDIETQKAKEAKEKAEKDRRVMKKSICKAFGVGGEEKEDVFSEEDGFEFLAQEIGFMKAEELEEEGRVIAGMVGYQKLALMMCGGMFAPISSKKKKYTWKEIKEYVEGIKGEIEGL
ncbi:hypothetical protein TrRE_jg9970 [Triparma retinervis]|uniref:Uncharacterized protein n=1 Tax=Triparma retinervis TaxID=2557542 RepID=A0A9W7ACJ7_9STRA|nr:hypothetical protein TrRE_jg9970 [Triparma retinervis]